MPPSSRPIRPNKRRSRPAPRQARPSAPVSDSSDEDFEIDDAFSSSDSQDDDNESVSQHSSSEESDLVDEKATPSLPRIRKRARRPLPGGSSARGSRKQNTSSDGEGSSVQLLNSGAEDESFRRGARRRSSNGASRRSDHINVSTDEGSEKRKGKRKLVEIEEIEVEAVESRMQITEETAATVCGICLSEEGTIERGKLDCCDHFFCFGCIMEWAKVESRCPMCKQRFATILRPTSGGSKRNRAVRIPLRDQVYVPPDDEVPVDDPYSDTVCMECHETGEEGLLLLCDNCDSAAHTYCVGLGRTVPRGDWFCRSCQNVIEEGSSDSDYEEEELVLGLSDDDEEAVLRAIVASTETQSQRTTRQAQTQRASTSAIRPITSSRRTRSARSGVRRRLKRRLSRSGRRRNRSVAAPRLSQAARDLMRHTESAGGQHSNTVETRAGPARTVPQQRRLQERIQIMRHNWGRIQEGDLQFTAIGVHSTAQRQEVANSNVGNIMTEAARSANELNSTKGNPNASSNSVGPVSVRDSIRSGSSELKQAWRMMEQAKSISVGASTSNAQQSLVSAPQDLRAVSKQTLGGFRQPAGSTTKTSAGINGRVSSITMFMKQSPAVENMKAFVTSNRTDRRENTHLEDLVGIHGLENRARLIGGTGKLPGEVGSRQHLVKGSSSSHGPVIQAAFGESGENSKWQLLNGTTCRNTTETGLNKSFVHCTGGEIGSQEKVPCNLVSLEKQRYTKEETGKLHISSGKEHGNVVLSDYSAHWPSHASDERVTAKEEHVSAAERERDGWHTSNIFNDKKEHLGKAGAAFSSSFLEREEGKTESLKDQLTDIVKKELWPLYLSEGLCKDEFKKIARSAVHSLYHSLNGKSSLNQLGRLSCGHVELQHISPIAGCCDKCLTFEVSKVIRTVKAKLQAS